MDRHWSLDSLVLTDKSAIRIREFIDPSSAMTHWAIFVSCEDVSSATRKLHNIFGFDKINVLRVTALSVL